MVFGRFFGRDKYCEDQATNLVPSASFFATNSANTVIDNIPLIGDYFKTGALSTDSWDFYITVASVGTAFVTIADYVPEDKRESVCVKIGEELFRFHPKGYQALENLNGLLHSYCDAGIPFHHAVGNWLPINLLGKDDPEKEDIEAFSVVGALIQQTFGGWFRKQKTV
jgi:hypothetical protein